MTQHATIGTVSIDAPSGSYRLSAIFFHATGVDGVHHGFLKYAVGASVGSTALTSHE